jgi:hypothetical protein
MPFALQYKPLIQSEDVVAKNLIKARNIYRISQYTYADGEKKTLSGNKSSIVFVIGIADQKLYCIKITQIKPEKFFGFVKNLFKNNATDKSVDESELFSDLIVKASRAGTKIFSVFKNHPLYKGNANAFRTYNIKGINQIKLVNFKKEIIKDYI